MGCCIGMECESDDDNVMVMQQFVLKRKSLVSQVLQDESFFLSSFPSIWKIEDPSGEAKQASAVKTLLELLQPIRSY